MDNLTLHLKQLEKELQETPQYIRQTLTDIKGETDSNIIIEGDFNTPLTPMDR